MAFLPTVNPEKQVNLLGKQHGRRGEGEAEEKKAINSKNNKQEAGKDRPGCAILFVPVK